MPRAAVTALDSSIIIAGLLAWHEAHERSFRALVQAKNAGSIVVPAPALVESYAVMTRLPAPHRLSPHDAIELLSGSFEKRSTIVSLTGPETWRFLHAVAEEHVGGGRSHDVLILRCARKAHADRLITLDRNDFTRLEPGDIHIMVPE